MGIETVAYIALALTAYTTYEQGEQARKAQSAQGRAREEEKKLRSEQTAQNAAAAAAERRQQVREERVRRARIQQSAVNTGTAGSSGELGATSALATNLSVNLGSNAGRVASGERQGQYAQNSATFMGEASDRTFDAKTWAGYGSLTSQVFGAAGGFKTIFSKAGEKPTASTG